MAVKSPVPGVPLYPVIINIEGQRTATVAAVCKFKTPAPWKILGVSATARASGGTTPTLTVDVLAGATPTSILSSAISVTAGTISEGTIATEDIADETAVQINLTIGGTSPTWDDITVQLNVAQGVN